MRRTPLGNTQSLSLIPTCLPQGSFEEIHSDLHWFRKDANEQTKRSAKEKPRANEKLKKETLKNRVLMKESRTRLELARKNGKACEREKVGERIEDWRKKNGMLRQKIRYAFTRPVKCH